MSNPVSLYVEDEDACLSELAHEDVMNCERPPNLRDYLEGADSDFYTMELSQLFEVKTGALKFQPADRLLRIILWSWLDGGEQICDVDSGKAEELGLDLAISPSTIQELGSVITACDPTVAASAIFESNEVWNSKSDLAEYLGRWTIAFSDALAQKKGLYYKVWV